MIKINWMFFVVNGSYYDGFYFFMAISVLWRLMYIMVDDGFMVGCDIALSGEVLTQNHMINHLMTIVNI